MLVALAMLLRGEARHVDRLAASHRPPSLANAAAAAATQACFIGTREDSNTRARSGCGAGTSAPCRPV
jgi:hypothetical protein